MQLKHWIEQKRGRGAALAKHLGVTKSFVSQMASKTCPVPGRMVLPIRKFTKGAVTFSALLPDESSTSIEAPNA